MSSQILNVLKQALLTFATKKQIPENFHGNLQTLIALLDKTTAEHVNFPLEYLNPEIWEQPKKAPVTCIEIYEDNFVTMGIFILKPNGRLPLHNHPQMHGLIKVIAGQVRITSYSTNTDKTRDTDQKGFDPVMPRPGKYGMVTAELNEVIVANPSSPPCVLEPDFKNLHEIQSVDGPAAFLDILAPPYDLPIPGYETRKCSYYSKFAQVASNIFRLQEVRSPSWYWTDSHPYTGPDVDEVDLGL